MATLAPATSIGFGGVPMTTVGPNTVMDFNAPMVPTGALYSTADASAATYPSPSGAPLDGSAAGAPPHHHYSPPSFNTAGWNSAHDSGGAYPPGQYRSLNSWPEASSSGGGRRQGHPDRHWV